MVVDPGAADRLETSDKAVRITAYGGREVIRKNAVRGLEG